MSTKIKASNIETGAVDSTALGDGSITTAKLSNLSVTKDKLHTNVIPSQVVLAEADIDVVNDYMLIYDASAVSLKKVSVASVKPNFASFSEHILPDTDVTYDLGSATYKWRDLYLSGNTIHLGDTQIKKDTDGNVEFKDASNNLKRIIVDEIQIGEGASKVRIKKEFDSGSGKNKIKFEEFDASNNKKTDADQSSIDLSMNDTNDLPEGSSNLYYTNARARNALSGTGLIGYNASNGTISFDGNTDGISEGSSNLFFTNTRARTQARLALSVTGDATYSNVSGALSISAPVRSVNAKTGALTLTNLDDSFWQHAVNESDLPSPGANNHGMIVHVHSTGKLHYVHGGSWYKVATEGDVSNVDVKFDQITLNQITDINAASPTDGKALVYDGATSKWIPGESFSAAEFTTEFNAKSTSNLSEGTNKYYTDGRVGSYLTTNTYATQSYVNTQVSNVIDSAPGALDTLNELAAALGDDSNFANTMTTNLGTKANNATTISAGFGLSGGGSLAANRTISHADTSSLSGAQTAPSGSVINSITVDSLGHISAVGTSNSIAASTTATRLATARTITLSGEASGSASFDGSGNITIAVDVIGGASDSATNAATSANSQLLDGLDSTHFKNAGNLNAGTIPSARLTGTYGIAISGNAASATNADTLDGYHAASFALLANTPQYSEGTTAPSGPNGSTWYNTAVGKTYMKQQNIWKQIAPGVGGTAVYDVNGTKVS